MSLSETWDLFMMRVFARGPDHGSDRIILGLQARFEHSPVEIQIRGASRWEMVMNVGL